MLSKVNKANMAWTLEVIEEYLRSRHGVMRVPLKYVIRKTIIVQTCGDYPKYVTPDEDMVARMFHLPLDKNKLHNKKSAQSVKEHMAE